MKEYKVMTTEGKEVMVSKEHAEHLMHDVWEDSDKRHEVIAKYLEDYKKRAEHNINKVANMYKASDNTAVTVAELPAGTVWNVSIFRNNGVPQILVQGL